MDLDNFYPSQEWDVLSVPARKNTKKYPCCQEPFPDITFEFTLRRKTLYYALNLIIPCVSINMLTLLAFYLPPDCGEKISICISLLLSLSIFQLLLMDLVPATSLTTPLLGKYILFTTILVTVSVGSSVMILNMNHRTGSFTAMPRFVRALFLGVLPKMLIMHRPTQEDLEEAKEAHLDWSDAHSDLAAYANPYKRRFRLSMQATRIPITEPGSSRLYGCPSRNYDHLGPRGSMSYPLNMHKAMDGVNFIAKHMKEDDEVQKVSGAFVSSFDGRVLVILRL
jgi:nicotinic acetylcholine receptor